MGNAAGPQATVTPYGVVIVIAIAVAVIVVVVVVVVAVVLTLSLVLFVHLKYKSTYTPPPKCLYKPSSLFVCTQECSRLLKIGVSK